MTTSMTC